MMRKAHGLLSATAQAELLRCVEEGLTARQARLRLVRCGVAMSERSVSRRLAECRVERRRIAEAEVSERRRLAEFEAIGRGLGSVQIGTTGAAEILRASVPGLREKQCSAVSGLFEQFLRTPKAEMFTGLVVACHAILLSQALTDRLGGVSE